MDNLRLGIDVTPVIWLKNLSRVPRLSVSSKVDFFVQNQWIVSTRISGLFRPELVDDLDQNTHCVMRTARSRISGVNLVRDLLMMTPLSQITEPPQIPGRFNELGLAYTNLDELMKSDSAVRERIEGSVDKKETTISSAITYSVNPNDGSPAFIGWLLSSPDDNHLVDYARQASLMMNEAIRSELKIQGYESIEQKHQIEGQVRGKSSQFDSLSQAITRDSDKVAELTKKKSELEKTLASLEQEKLTLEPKVEPVIKSAEGKVIVADNSEFSFDDMYWESTTNFRAKEINLRGSVKNNTNKYIKGIKFEGWIIASGVSGPTKLSFNTYISGSVAPGKTAKVYGSAVTSDSVFGGGAFVSAAIAHSKRVGGWLRAVEYDTDTERNIRTTTVGEDVARYMTIDADLSVTINAIQANSAQLASLNESVDMAKRQKEALREELATATKLLPKSSALYQKFAGSQVKAGL